MQKLLLSIFFISLCASAALAQSSDDYNKVEFYGGYSNARVQPNVGTFSAGGSPFIPPCSSEGRAQHDKWITTPSSRATSTLRARPFRLTRKVKRRTPSHSASA